MGAKAAKETMVKGAKKAIYSSGSKPGARVRKSGQGARKTAGGWVSEIKEAILSMTASIAESNAKTDASIEKLVCAQTETDASIEKLIRAQTETDAGIEKLIRAQTETDVKFEDLARTQKESILAMEKAIQNLSASVEKTTSDLAASIDKANLNVGGINRSIGRVVEMVVLPGLMEAMNTLFDYQFDNVSSDKIFRDNGRQYAEVDLFLENGVSVMAVEAKTRVKRSELNDFVEKLEKLRKHENKAGLVGKTIYAAVAGITFDTNAEAFAKEKGMYLVKINQNKDKINIEPPTGEVGKW